MKNSAFSVGICVWLQLFKPKMDRVFVEGKGGKMEESTGWFSDEKTLGSGDCRVNPGLPEAV